ncbi:hypothetical protein [Methylocaldum sp.]|uniref:hypothetical protein n=1 Tax=Methylocaldum sp. TaxID=1969727 RepID=UPI002D733AFD|nr:hypothetical protein [Methylocaldum sp.]HYE34051.1 hypothetical protein [Methylocaldum sp.]
MSTLKKVHEAIEASRAAADFNISEDPGHLWIGGAMSRAALSAWQAVVDDQCSWLTLECKDEAQDTIEPKDGREGEKQRLSLRFQSSDATPHLFTPEGWRSFLQKDLAISSARTVRLAFTKNGFNTRAFSIEPWINSPTTLELQDERRVSDSGPRRQVRCQSPDLMAPAQIEPWILAGPAPDNCEAVTIWQEIAAQMIAKSLPNDLYKDGGISKVGLSGQPPRRLDLGTFQADEVPFQALQEAATWVYLEGDDVEVRHTFLSAELARAWTPDASFCVGLESRLVGALDSARLVYKAHLRSGSKDTLKALADLRKTLADEVQKLLQQARDLSSAVWRDVAIAIGVVGIRVAMDGTKAGKGTFGFAAIYLLVAIYIVTSYVITVATYGRFLDIVETSRKSWRTKLYAFLDDDDYQTLADKPLTDAVAAYRNTQARTTIVVLVVVFALLIGITVEIQWMEDGLLVEHISRNWSKAWSWLTTHL